MNAIIALCHFCELHGPSVMFCTQSFHDSDDPQAVLEDNSCFGQSIQNKKKYYGKPQIYQRFASINSVANNCDSSKTKECATLESCEACKFIPSDVSGFISNDHTAKVSYISTHHPLHPEIFSIVRQACVRSLSCEVCPGREGPIFFGDQTRGHVYSHTFFVKDSHARGFQRWYSIIVVMMDKIFLLNSWPFLTKHIRTVIDEIQEKANRVYQLEQAECPQRVIRLNSLTEMTPRNFRRSRGVNKSMRSLAELTNDKDVFANVHLWFTWMLKAGGNRMTEKLLEGPPIEDTVIDIEKQEETEEGFMLVSTKKVPKDVALQSLSVKIEAEKSTSNSKEFKIKNIQHLYKVLGQQNFRILAFHVVIGNQVIVVCEDEELTSAIIHHFKIMLPKGCAHDIPHSDNYVNSWKCNFIGLKPTTPLPPHLKSSLLHVVLEIKKKSASGFLSNDLTSYHYQIYNSFELPDKGPAVFHRMMSVIENDSFTERVVLEFFISLKEEWMNKVKVLYKFSRTGNPSVQDTNKLLQVLGAHERDKQVLKFWMTGLSAQFKNHVLTSNSTLISPSIRPSNDFHNL